jgi:hypothetical protein
MVPMMIAEIHQVLSPIDCRLFINYVKNNDLNPLRVSGRGVDPSVRSGIGMWIKKPLLDASGLDINLKLRAICSSLTGRPIENMEFTHVVRYGLGGEYKPHYDSFNPVDSQNIANQGSLREFSLLVYLNDGYTGGETEFTRRGIMITPKIGKLLMWSNLNEDGTIDELSKHAGLPITAGEKWIAIVWVRKGRIAANNII